MIKFYQRGEIETLASVSGKPYRSNNAYDHKLGHEVGAEVAQKTAYWAEQVCFDDFISEPSRHWQFRNRFMRYTWARIYRKKDKGRGIYFTVGVDYDTKAINYKLDCQHSVPNKGASKKIELSKEQIQKFNSLVEGTSAEWNPINIDEISHWDWPRLIATTKEFIINHTDIYNEVVEALHGTPVESRIARICWNTNDWTKPSGREGKSKSKSHEKKYGFGHEEWLFDLKKIIDGYQYGFLEPIRKYQNTYSGRRFDIRLFTIDGITHKWFWVGELKGVKVLGHKETAEALSVFRKRGLYDAMKQDLQDAGLNRDALTEEVKALDIFNVKFKPEAADGLLYEMVEMTETERASIGNRYTLFYPGNLTWDAGSKEQKINGYSFEGGSTSPDTRGEKYRARSKDRSRELTYRHAPLLNALLGYLQEKYGIENARRECPAYGNSSIDVVRRTSSGDIFFEVKTYPDVRSSLRVAVGQILEYAFYAGQENAIELIIVSEPALRDPDRRYLQKLNGTLKIPLHYMQFDVKTKKPIEIYP